jgi:hypothetical protein
MDPPAPGDANPSDAPTNVVPTAGSAPQQSTPTPASSVTVGTTQSESVSHAPPASSIPDKDERLTLKDIAAITGAAQKFEPLNATNWLAWKDNITNLLEMSDLESHISSTTVPPDMVADPVGAKYWRKMERATHAIITCSIDNSQKVYVTQKTEKGEKRTAAQIWQALKERHQPHGTIASFETLREFWHKRADDDDDLLKHLDEMMEYRVELEMMGNTIPDDQFKQHILGSLPKSWDQWINNNIGAVIDISKIPMPLGQLVMHIRNEYKRRAGRDSKTSETYYVGGPRASKKRKIEAITKGACSICGRTNHNDSNCRFKGKPKCGKCSKFGHTTEDCWSGKGKGKEKEKMCERRTAPPAPKKAKVEAHIVEKDDDTDESMSTILQNVTMSSDEENDTSSTYDWIEDSGSTSHVVNKQTLLTDFVPK